jgi:alkylhydroperoxidase family enzyme
MPRIPYPDPEKLSPAVRAAISQAPLNVMRMMAGASEGVFNGFGAFTGSFYTGTKLDPVLREVAILRVGYLCKSLYETYQHEAAARLLKMSDAKIDAIKKGGKHPGVLTDQEQAVMDFTEEVVVNVKASDATLAAVRKFLPDNIVLDLILVIGAYMVVSRLLENTGVELDEKPQDWDDMNKRMKAMKA